MYRDIYGLLRGECLEGSPESFHLVVRNIHFKNLIIVIIVQRTWFSRTCRWHTHINHLLVIFRSFLPMKICLSKSWVLCSFIVLILCLVKIRLVDFFVSGYSWDTSVKQCSNKWSRYYIFCSCFIQNCH